MLHSDDLADKLTERGGRYTIVGRQLAKSNPFEIARVRVRLEDQKIGYKPKGLWYSVGGEWLSWLASEMPNWIVPGQELWALDVRTAPSPVRPRVWLLDTEEKVRDLTEHYGTGASAWSRDADYIDWRAVASLCGGVEIAPYQWDLRLDPETSWYYGWDVASGCIWDPLALRGQRLVARCIEGPGEPVWVPAS